MVLDKLEGKYIHIKNKKELCKLVGTTKSSLSKYLSNSTKKLRIKENYDIYVLVNMDKYRDETYMLNDLQLSLRIRNDELNRLNKLINERTETDNEDDTYISEEEGSMVEIEGLDGSSDLSSLLSDEKDDKETDNEKISYDGMEDILERLNDLETSLETPLEQKSDNI